MIWSRKFFDQWEWYHKPISPMEESLLLSEHIDSSLTLATKRLRIKFPKETWKVIDGYLYFRGDYLTVFLQPELLVLPFKFFKNISKAKKTWEEFLPAHLQKISNLNSINLKTSKTDDLLKFLDETVELEGKLLSESMYAVVFAMPAELFLKFAYKLLVKDKNPLNYNELLVGYSDRGIESDIILWEVSQEESKVKREKLISAWIKEYGYRIQDKDILYPTLGENKQMIVSLLNLYKYSPNPKERVIKAQVRRQDREKYVEQNLRFSFFTKRLFEKIKNQAQEYARIRNSRPYYYMGNRVIRQILIELARRTNLTNPEKVFYLTIDELKQGLLKNIKLDEIVKDREKEYNQRLNQEPKLTIKTT